MFLKIKSISQEKFFISREILQIKESAFLLYHRIFRAVSLLLVFSLLFSLFGCGAEPSLLRYDISDTIDSLDPQFADDEGEQLVIYNMMEGLMRQLPSGELVNGVIEDYEVSPDQTCYTFKLIPGMVWDDKEHTPVTAHDFVFAFRRIFNSIYPSPFASMYSSIKNSEQVLTGELPDLSLGVTAVDDLTVQFLLDYADPSFLENLSHSSAMPCSEKIFKEANGKYGTTIKETYSNGPFYLMRWEEGNRIYLKKNDRYYAKDEVISPGVYLYMDRDVTTKAQEERGETAATRFELLLDGKSDGCLADYSQYRKAKSQGMECEETENIVWALMFNQNHSAFQNQKVRQGFLRSIDRTSLKPFLTENRQENLRTYDRLIPPAISIFTESYTEQTSVSSINAYNPQSAYNVYREGMEELGADTLRKIQLLVPSENNIPEMCGMLQQAWQSSLAVSVNIQEVSRDELSSRLSSGDYHVALVPLKASANLPADILGRFRSSSVQNQTAYHNEVFDQTLDSAISSHNKQTVLQQYEKAETILMDDAVIYPLLVETSYFVLGPNVEGLAFYPYGGKIMFRDAVSIR